MRPRNYGFGRLIVMALEVPRRPTQVLQPRAVIYDDKSSKMNYHYV